MTGLPSDRNSAISVCTPALAAPEWGEMSTTIEHVVSM
jgi:hypothetical protein